jgi:hypothetical protein
LRHQADCDVPWARAGSEFTLMFEAYIMILMPSIPVKRIAELVSEHEHSGRFQQFGPGCKSQSQRIPYNRISDNNDLFNHQQATFQPDIMKYYITHLDSKEPKLSRRVSLIWEYL